MDKEESIYNLINLIPIQFSKICKPERHTSKFKDDIKNELNGSKQSKKTIGPEKQKLKKPHEFLKKKEKSPSIPKTNVLKLTNGENKLSVPKHDEKPPCMGEKRDVNYVSENALQAIKSTPKSIEKSYVDTKKGDSHLLKQSGLDPNHVHKKDYGEVPIYLQKRKEDMAKAQEEYDKFIADHFRKGAMQKLTPELRREIINGLKTNWDEIHREFQRLSVMTDTIPKRARKEKMEMQMAQLEKDIELVEKHSVIYIAH